MKKHLIVFFLSMVMTTAACGGGGGGSSSSDDSSGSGDTTVEGMAIAQQMSLVTDNSSTSSSLSRMLRYAVPTGGEYATDEPEVFMYDRSMEGLDFVNEVLCYINQTHYADVGIVNAGPYVVTLDGALCDGRQDHGDSSAGSQSGGQEQDFETWVVNSVRDDEESPQTLFAWIPDDEIGGEMLAEMVIEQPANDTNHFGVFTLNYYASSEYGEMMGTLSVDVDDAGNVTLQISSDEFGSTRIVNAVIGSDDSGRGHMETSGMFFDGGTGDGGTETVDVAYDSDHFLSSFNGGDQFCRDRQNHLISVYGYNIYNEAGDLVRLNSGFPVRMGEHHGWASIYGIWMPEEAGLSSGDSLTREDADETFTADITPGRLVERTRHVMPIDDIVGITAFMWDNDAGESMQVRFDSTQGQAINVVKIGTEICDDNGCRSEPLDNPETLSFEPFEWINVWNASMNFTLVASETGGLDRSMEVPYFTQRVVMPDDPILAGDGLNLKCFSGCLKAGLTADDMLNGTHEEPFDWSEESPEPYIYSINSDYVLMHNGSSVTIEMSNNGQDPNASNGWGVMSNAMVDVDANLENHWEIWDAQTTYSWETGPNEWNHLSVLRNAAGAVHAFDQPKECFSQHPEFGPVTYQYGGPGQFWGIPWEEVEMDDGAYTRWVAAYTLDDGTELECDGENYYVRQMVVEKMMEEDNIAECSDLSIDASLGAPDITFDEPSNGANPCADTTCPTVEELL